MPKTSRNVKLNHTSEVLYHRKRHIIRSVDGKQVFVGTYKVKIAGVMHDMPSVNAAKHHSRKLQEMHGHGCLRVTA